MKVRTLVTLYSAGAATSAKPPIMTLLHNAIHFVERRRRVVSFQGLEKIIMVRLLASGIALLNFSADAFTNRSARRAIGVCHAKRSSFPESAGYDHPGTQAS